MATKKNDIVGEAQAFSERILDRTKNGFIPDLRNLSECDYFYKSFWRRPIYADLYFGEIVRGYVEQFSSHLNQGDVILDFGCGPGYCALELARAGFEVIALDISEEAIVVATGYLKRLEAEGESLAIQYHVGSVELLAALPRVNGVLFSGVLHHLPDCEDLVAKVKRQLLPNALIVAHEPQHTRFQYEDARVVATIRLFLMCSGLWHEQTGESNFSFDAYVNQLHTEYALERDPCEQSGQSPNDLSVDGDEILAILRDNFLEIATHPTFSFIYRMMGGIRADEATENMLAAGLAKLDRLLVDSGDLNANYFMWVGRNRSQP